MSKYSEEFKSYAVSRYRDNPGSSLRDVAAELGISPSTLRRWVEESWRAAEAERLTIVNEFHASAVHTLLQAKTIEQVFIAAPGEHEEKTWPMLIGALPLLAADRQDRDVDSELAVVLDGGGTAVVCQVLSGMGGVGKTQIATAYARDQWDNCEVDLLVWITATSREGIIDALAEAAVSVCGATHGDNKFNAGVFLTWLTQPVGKRWLVVLDDLTDPGDLKDLWPPFNRSGRTIVTTRRRDAALNGVGRHLIDVDLFTEKEAEKYLAERFKGDRDRLDGAGELATALGRLPLALSQAAAYILDQPGLSCRDYLDLFADRSVRLAELSPDALPDGHERTVAATWSLSIERADLYEPKGVATPVLRLACLLDPNAIPSGLFTCGHAQRFLFGGSSEDENSVLRLWKIKSLISRMHRLSLLDYDGTQVRVHALVQRAVFDGLDESEHVRAAETAADSLAELWPSPDNNLASTATLRSNIDYLLRSSETALFAERAHPTLLRAGHSLSSHGQVTAATEYFQYLHEISERQLGPDHIDTIGVYSALAVSLGTAGDAAGAVTAYNNILSRCVRTLGEDHPNTRAISRDLTLLRSAAQSTQASEGLRNTFIR